jgi:hypothetical protein
LEKYKDIDLVLFALRGMELLVQERQEFSLKKFGILLMQMIEERKLGISDVNKEKVLLFVFKSLFFLRQNKFSRNVHK